MTIKKKFKKPPMAQAIREFVAAMEMPPTEKGSDANLKHAALVLAMLQHSKGLTSNATAATCSPSLAQLAAILHCSPSTIQRRITKLELVGLLTSKRRGTVSNLFTIYKTSQQLTTRETCQQLTSNDRSTRASRQVNSTPKTGQLGRKTGQLPPHERSTADHLRGRASGVEPQDITQEINPQDGETGKTSDALKLPVGCKIETKNGVKVLVGGAQ